MCLGDEKSIFFFFLRLIPRHRELQSKKGTKEKKRSEAGRGQIHVVTPAVKLPASVTYVRCEWMVERRELKLRRKFKLYQLSAK